MRLSLFLNVPTSQAISPSGLIKLVRPFDLKVSMDLNDDGETRGGRVSYDDLKLWAV